MAQTFHPAIKKLARTHRLGTPEQLYTRHLVSLRLLFGISACFALFDIFYSILTLQSNANTSTVRGDPVGLVVVMQFFLAVLICFMGSGYFQPYYCRCTEGFLVLKRGDPPKLLHAVRWDDVTSTRRVPTVGEVYLLPGIITMRAQGMARTYGW